MPSDMIYNFVSNNQQTSSAHQAVFVTKIKSDRCTYDITQKPHSGKSVTIRESNHDSEVYKEHYA